MEVLEWLHSYKSSWPYWLTYSFVIFSCWYRITSGASYKYSLGHGITTNSNKVPPSFVPLWIWIKCEWHDILDSVFFLTQVYSSSIMKLVWSMPVSHRLHSAVLLHWQTSIFSYSLIYLFIINYYYYLLVYGNIISPISLKRPSLIWSHIQPLIYSRCEMFHYLQRKHINFLTRHGIDRECMVGRRIKILDSVGTVDREGERLDPAVMGFNLPA